MGFMQYCLFFVSGYDNGEYGRLFHHKTNLFAIFVRNREKTKLSLFSFEDETYE